MELIDIQQLHSLPQLPAASAMVCLDGRLWLIGDNSQYLHVVDVQGHARRHPLRADARPVAEPLGKQHKADFESLILEHDRAALLVLPSGSTAQRCQGVRVTLAKTDQVDYTVAAVAGLDFAPLFSRVMAASGLASEDFNIEGAGAWGAGRWFLLNRGNGPAARNLFVQLEGHALAHARPVACQALELPRRHGLMASLTDGCIHAGHLYVVAACEEGQSTYDDGRRGGSLIAAYRLSDLGLQGYCLLPGKTKFEGLAVEHAHTTAAQLSLLLCTDNDEPDQPGAIYRARLRV